MTPEQNSKCHVIIHTASVAAAGVGFGLAQAVGADCVALATIQTTMIISLGKVFDLTINAAAARAMAIQLFASQLGKQVAKVGVTYAVKWIPGIGNTVNSIVAAGLTESMGWLVAEEMDKGLI